MVKTLVLDIETQPALVYAWGLWDQNVGLNQIVDRGGVLSWAGMWAGEEHVMFDSIQRNSRHDMLLNMYNLLEEADEVVGWNSNSFDLKHLNGEFWLQGWAPPAPYKRIDLMRVVKSNFKMLSNKLEFNLQERLGEHKLKHEGFELWTKCIAGDKEAWRIMEEYNCQDTIRTEQLYQTLRPWIPGSGVNRSAEELAHVCPECGGKHLQRRGVARTTTQQYRRYQCVDCGTWSRARLSGDAKEVDMLVKVVR